MTIDEIAQRIYEERYQEPARPEIAQMLRDGMVRLVALYGENKPCLSG